MTDLTPKHPLRPLIWPETILDWSETLPQQLDLPPLYIVGGAVRDAYLHRPVKDIDLATPENAIALARRLADHLNADVYVLDRERDVARILAQTPEGPLTLDVAGFRGADLAADLHDRDFTLNAMAVSFRDLEQLIDPLDAEKDIAAKLIRCCSADSIANDPIRALRAVRFSVHLAMHMESSTLEQVRRHGPDLIHTSEERIRDELFNILRLNRVSAALRVLFHLGLLQLLLPEVGPVDGLAQPLPHRLSVWEHTLLTIDKLQGIILAISPARTDGTAANFDLGMMVIQLDQFRGKLQHHLSAAWPNERPHTALLIFAALLHDLGKAVSVTDRRLYQAGSVKIAAGRADFFRLSSDEKERLLTILSRYEDVFMMEDLSPLALHRFWYSLGAAGIDLCLLALADYLGTVGNYLEQDYWLVLVDRVRTLLLAYFEQYDRWVDPPLVVNGNQLMTALELSPGPIIGRLLTAIREAQVIETVRTPEEAIQFARERLKQGDLQ